MPLCALVNLVKNRLGILRFVFMHIEVPLSFYCSSFTAFRKSVNGDSVIGFVSNTSVLSLIRSLELSTLRYMNLMGQWLLVIHSAGMQISQRGLDRSHLHWAKWLSFTQISNVQRKSSSVSQLLTVVRGAT